MAGEDDDSKQHEPTQKKLDDARKRGEVARSSDLNTAMSYLVLLLLASAVGASTMTGLGGVFAAMLERSDQLAQNAFQGSGGPVLANAVTSIAWHLTPWLLMPMVAVLGLTVVTRSFVVSPEKLMPKLNRISPLSNAKNKFGRSGLFEFFKSFVKLSIYSVILGIFIWVNLPEMLAALALNPGMVSVLLLELSVEFFAIVLLVALVIGGIDFLWQKQEHLRKNRMSHKELMDEIKQNEGDPHMKGQRRQKAYDIATNQMLQDVPDADVIVVNPTHYAVALKWSRLPGEAPVCVAKGVDEIAARIREVASENGVPIHRDPPTARALHATVEIGQEVPPDQYQAVAAAIRFAENMRQRAKNSLRT